MNNAFSMPEIEVLKFARNEIMTVSGGIGGDNEGEEFPSGGGGIGGDNEGEEFFG